MTPRGASPGNGGDNPRRFVPLAGVDGSGATSVRLDVHPLRTSRNLSGGPCGVQQIATRTQYSPGVIFLAHRRGLHRVGNASGGCRELDRGKKALIDFVDWIVAR